MNLIHYYCQNLKKKKKNRSFRNTDNKILTCCSTAAVQFVLFEFYLNNLKRNKCNFEKSLLALITTILEIRHKKTKPLHITVVNQITKEIQLIYTDMVVNHGLFTTSVGMKWTRSIAWMQPLQICVCLDLYYLVLVTIDWLSHCHRK